MPGPGFYLIGKEEEDELVDLIRSRYLFRYGSAEDPSFKHRAATLEDEVKSKFKVKHALAVSSGTGALMTALSAAGIGPGDEVIVPGYTFIASISTVILCQAVPVLAEVDESLTLDPDDVERKITPSTRAIIAVHMLGNPCNLQRLTEIARKHNLLLIEDAAQSFGGSYHGTALGTIGDVGIYSFNIFKTINSGDGGMLVTNDDAVFATAFSFHDQGHLPLRMGTETGNRAVIGQNFRITELNAAVLLAQFRKLDQIIGRLRALKARFKERISGIEGVGFRRINDADGECSTLLTVLLPNKEVADGVAKRLDTPTVANSGWHVYNNMEHILEMKTINPKNNPLQNPHYKGNAELRKGMLPTTDRLVERAINLSVGVVDRGIGAAFGINVNSTDEEIDEKAERFRRAAMEAMREA